MTRGGAAADGSPGPGSAGGAARAPRTAPGGAAEAARHPSGSTRAAGSAGSHAPRHATGGALREADGWLPAAVHLFALSGFAFAQPLFDLLGRDATFFVARRAGRVDLAALVSGLVVGLPLLLVLIELAASLLGRRARSAVHRLLVAALMTAVALPLLTRAFPAPGRGVLPLSVAAGAAGALLYVRWRPLRSLLAVAAFGPLVFAGTFLANSDVLRATDRSAAVPVDDTTAAATPEHADAAAVATPTATAGSRPADMVLLVLDELPLGVVLGADGAIDPALFPNLARLAADGTWYRNATAQHGFTPFALPALLTGRAPDDDELLPVVADHPRNLFTLLADTHRLVVHETLTELCPAELLFRARPRRPLGQRLVALAVDLPIIWSHVALPAVWTDGLPPITRGWSGFWRFEEAPGIPVTADNIAAQERFTRADFDAYRDRAGAFRAFVDAIDADDRPTLYFHHSLLPHGPWLYLPSGMRYDEGLDAKKSLLADAAPSRLADLSLQHHLLQAGFADRLVGELLDRLEALGLYDRALVVVTADHGISFRSVAHQRVPDADNVRDFMHVPLLVKLPGQTAARVDDRNVESMDVAPTILDALGIDAPDLEGHSALSAAPPPRDHKTFHREGAAPLVVPAHTDDVGGHGLERRRALFGTAPRWRDVLAMGADSPLLDRPLAQVRIVGTAAVEAVLYDEDRLARVEPGSTFLPCSFIGAVTPRESEIPLQRLAIAVNGVVRAVVDTFPPLDGARRFAAMVPEASFREGANEVDLLAVVGAEECLALARVE